MNQPLTIQQTRMVLAFANVSHKTLGRYLAGEACQRGTRERIEAALRELELTHAIRSAVAEGPEAA